MDFHLHIVIFMEYTFLCAFWGSIFEIRFDRSKYTELNSKKPVANSWNITSFNLYKSSFNWTVPLSLTKGSWL